MATKFDIRNYTDGFKGFAVEGDCKIVRLNDEFDQWIYILNTKTNRATRFNAEGTNGKRIPVATFEEKYEAWLEREANKAYEEAQIEEAQTEETWIRHPEGEDLTKPAVIDEHGCVDCSKFPKTQQQITATPGQPRIPSRKQSANPGQAPGNSPSALARPPKATGLASRRLH